MIQRVEDRKPNYQLSIWANERQQNLTYLANISKFPELYTPWMKKKSHKEGKQNVSSQDNKKMNDKKVSSPVKNKEKK